MLRRTAALPGIVLLAAGLWLGLAQAAEVAVLSAGAVEPGLAPAIAAYERSSGDRVVLRLATAPQLRERVLAGETADLIVAPPALLDEFAARGRLRGPSELRRELGSIGIGVVLPAGSAPVDLSTTVRLAEALRRADELVYNRASTGQYLDALLARLGLVDTLAPKTVRYPDGASVMRHVAASSRASIGFGAITEILPFDGRGLRYAGPLPPDAQNRTRYVAAPTSAEPNDAARRLLVFLATDEAADFLRDAGIEAPR